MPDASQTGRRTGRPSAEGSEALDRHILHTAIRLFSERGYAGTSIEQIAAAAGTGKQTIYRRYASKEELFKAVLTALGEHLVDAAATHERTAADPLAALRGVCLALLELVCVPEVVDIYRILIAEAPRFPAVTDHVARTCIEPFDDIVLRLIGAAAQAGQIGPGPHGRATAQALVGLFTGKALTDALLGRGDLCDPDRRAAFFDTAWSIFLRGVGRRAGRDGEGAPGLRE